MRCACREHVFPAWLGKVLPGEGEFMFVHARDGHPPTSWRSGALSLTYRGICDSCNHWLGSNVEETARPVLTRLIEGTPTTLPVTAQIVVATWSVKTAAMAELTYDDASQVMSAGALQEIRAHGIAPRAVGVWVTAVAQPAEPVAIQPVYAGTITLPDGNELKGANWFQTFRLGALVRQAAGHTYDAPLRVDTDAAKRGIASRIWPIDREAVEWPPPYLLDEPGFVAHAEPEALA